VLDSDRLENFRQKLLQLQSELSALQETGDAAARVVELDQTSVGRLSRMDALQGQAMSKERGRRRTLELQKIAAALRRIESGEYGYCLACDEPIAPQRLSLDPAATLCIDCASARESG
jgi:DnaK suppressor protein